MSRLFRSRPFVALLLGVPLALAVAAVPGLRHRHGEGGHTHADATDAARDGWHVHLSLFGLEVTIWEPSSDGETGEFEEASVATADDRPIEREHNRGDEGPVFVASSPLTSGWVSLLCLDPGPLPARVAASDVDPASSPLRPSHDRCESRTDAPAVPPPEAA